MPPHPLTSEPAVCVVAVNFYTARKALGKHGMLSSVLIWGNSIALRGTPWVSHTGVCCISAPKAWVWIKPSHWGLKPSGQHAEWQVHLCQAAGLEPLAGSVEIPGRGQRSRTHRPGLRGGGGGVFPRPRSPPDGWEPCPGGPDRRAKRTLRGKPRRCQRGGEAPARFWREGPRMKHLRGEKTVRWKWVKDPRPWWGRNSEFRQMDACLAPWIYYVRKSPWPRFFCLVLEKHDFRRNPKHNSVWRCSAFCSYCDFLQVGRKETACFTGRTPPGARKAGGTGSGSRPRRVSHPGTGSQGEEGPVSLLWGRPRSSGRKGMSGQGARFPLP